MKFLKIEYTNLISSVYGVQKRVAASIVDKAMSNVDVPVLFNHGPQNLRAVLGEHTISDLHTCQFIMLGSPLSRDEETIRMEEMESFISDLHAAGVSRFSSGSNADEKMFIKKLVSSWKEFSECIKEYFSGNDEMNAKNTLHVFILLFGHGTPESFRFQCDPVPVPIDDINWQVRVLWLETLERIPKQIPASVETVHCQCLTHLCDTRLQYTRLKLTFFH